MAFAIIHHSPLAKIVTSVERPTRVTISGVGGMLFSELLSVALCDLGGKSLSRQAGTGRRSTTEVTEEYSGKRKSVKAEEMTRAKLRFLFLHAFPCKPHAIVGSKLLRKPRKVQTSLVSEIAMPLFSSCHTALPSSHISFLPYQCSLAFISGSLPAPADPDHEDVSPQYVS